MAKNELEIIIEQNALAPSKAKYILEQFQRFFGVADEWALKAKTLVVTSASQTTEMEMARTGRLFLRDKRIAIESARKELKEQSLKEGRTIDSIANTLKSLIVPIEDFLGKQEKFVELQEEAKLEAKRQEIERRMKEEERIAAEIVAAEQERLRVENEQLKKTAQANEIALQAERKKQTDILNAERAKADEELREVARKAKIESDKQAKKLAAEREKANAEREEAAEKARALKEKERAKLEVERKEKERLEALLKAQVECPKCHHKFTPNKGEK